MIIFKKLIVAQLFTATPNIYVHIARNYLFKMWFNIIFQSECVYKYSISTMCGTFSFGVTGLDFIASLNTTAAM